MELAVANVPKFNNNVVAMVSHGDDTNLRVEFFTEDVYQPFLSEKEGRAVYNPVEMVRVTAPGSKSEYVTLVHHPKPGPEDFHKAKREGWDKRFPRQYAAFKAQQEQVPDGTPLEMCKFIASHRVKELKASGLHTAEQYAATPDSIVQTLGMGAFRERELCKTFIGNDDQKVREVSNLLQKNSILENDMEAMKQQMADLNRRMAEQMAGNGQIYQSTLETVPKAKRGPGRPPKQKETE